MALTGPIPDQLSAVAAGWARAAAGFVPFVPVQPEVAPSYEAHVVATICVEILQPLAGMAPRWTPDVPKNPLGRVEVKMHHLEAVGAKVGRDLGLGELIADTDALCEELKVRSIGPKREGSATDGWYAVTVTEEEATAAQRALEALATALSERFASTSRQAGTPDYRFRDGPAVLAFWSMKVEACSPGVTQRFGLRFARRNPGPAIADAAAELLERLRSQPADVAGGERHSDLVALCERTLTDLGRPTSTS